MKLFNHKILIYVCAIILIFNIHISLVKTTLTETDLEYKNKFLNRLNAYSHADEPDADADDKAADSTKEKKPDQKYNGQFNPDDKVVPLDKSDEEVKKIRDEIYKLAGSKLKSQNLAKKGRQNGKFGNTYNEFIKAKGNDSRKNKKLWPFMNDITTPFEYCINPIYSVTYSKFCSNSYIGNKTKLDGKFLFFYFKINLLNSM